MSRKVLGLIPARGGSKGLPGKNIKPLYGKPLINWTIESALQSRYITRVVVSTDDQNIADIARDAGAEVPFLRPEKLSSDTASVIDAIFDAFTKLNCEWDYIVLLQPTSPLRQASDIDDAFELMLKRKSPAIVSTMPLHKPQRFLTVKREDNRLSLWINKTDIHYDRPTIEMLNGAVYISSIQHLNKYRSFTSDETLSFGMPFERSWDIDSIFDFMICEMLMPYVLSGDASSLNPVRR